MRHALATLALAVGLTACGSATAGPSTTRDTRSAALEAARNLPAACSLLGKPTVRDVLGAGVEGGEQQLERDGTLYANTCLWGDETSDAGAIGVQIGGADADGHDMVKNRSWAIKPPVEINDIKGAIGSMYVAVLPVGGTKGASVFFTFGEVSVLVAVTGRHGNLEKCIELATEVYDTLAG